MTNTYALLRNFYNGIVFHQQADLPAVQFITLHQWDSQIVDHPHTTDEWVQHFSDECFDNVFVIRNGKVFDVLNDPGVNWNVDEFYNTYVSVALDEAVWGAAN